MRKLCLAFLLVATSAHAQVKGLPPVTVVNSPNTLSWPTTTRITSIEVTAQGVRPHFDKCEQWPDVTPPGWDGPLRFTLHLLLNVGGEWWESGIIQFWACDQFSGGPIYEDRQIARNWVYDSRWGNMNGYQPAAGELIGFMVSAGNARGQDDHRVAERSQVVGIHMPSGATTFNAPFAFDEDATPAPQPAPQPVPTPLPVPAPTCPNNELLTAIMNARFDRVDAEVQGVKQDVAEFRAAVKSKYESVVNSPLFKYGVTALGTWFAARAVAK